jgi:hypothetical protein
LFRNSLILDIPFRVLSKVPFVFSRSFEAGANLSSDFSPTTELSVFALCSSQAQTVPGPAVAKGLQLAKDIGNVEPKKEQVLTLMLKLHNQAVSISSQTPNCALALIRRDASSDAGFNPTQ